MKNLIEDQIVELIEQVVFIKNSVIDQISYKVRLTRDVTDISELAGKTLDIDGRRVAVTDVYGGSPDMRPWEKEDGITFPSLPFYQVLPWSKGTVITLISCLRDITPGVPMVIDFAGKHTKSSFFTFPEQFTMQENPTCPRLTSDMRTIQQPKMMKLENVYTHPVLQLSVYVDEDGVYTSDNDHTWTMVVDKEEEAKLRQDAHVYVFKTSEGDD